MTASFPGRLVRRSPGPGREPPADHPSWAAADARVCTAVHRALYARGGPATSDADLPDYGYICAYDRPVKKRGRTRLASRPNNTATTPAAIDVQMVGASQLPSASTNSSLSFLIDPVEELAAGGDQVPAGEVGDAARRDGIHPCIAFDGDPFGQEASQGSPLLRWRRPSPTATARCRYRVLDPLLPYLSDILSVPTACDLFDVYLTDPGSSPFRYAPPYVLTRIFRKKSLLHPTNPRPLSAALLATILWCCAQAAELPSLLAPGARSRTTKALYDLAVALISERHVGQWWRGDAQPLSEPDAPRDSTSTDDSQPTDRNDIREHLGAVDDVLAYLLLCIAVSGGEFKADCQEWWHRAIRTTMTLGLHCEDEACLLGVDCTRPMCACRVPSGEPSLAFLEAKEERRRVFWLLYCLDRHLALSFNRTLQMPDSYVEVRGRLPFPSHQHGGLQMLTLTRTSTSAGARVGGPGRDLGSGLPCGHARPTNQNHRDELLRVLPAPDGGPGRRHRAAPRPSASPPL